MKSTKKYFTVLFIAGLLVQLAILPGCEEANLGSNYDEWSQLEKELLTLIQNDLVVNDALKVSKAPLSDFDVEAADRTGVLSNNINYAFFSGVEAAMYGIVAYSMGPDPDGSIDEDDIGMNRATRSFVSCVMGVLEGCGSATIHLENGEIYVHADCELE